MRVPLVWSLGRLHLGLETVVAARCSRVAILQNVWVVKIHGMSATWSGAVDRWGGTPFGDSFRRSGDLSETTPRCSNSATAMILPGGIFTLKASSSRKAMSRKSKH